jgi:uncharacterized protein
VVQVQDPRMDPARFDLVVPPAHDRLSGPNVVSLTGAPVWFDREKTAGARRRAPHRPWDPPVVIVIVGGTSKRHRLDEARTGALVADLEALASRGLRLRITTSRRTPDHARNALRAFAVRTGQAIFDNEVVDGPNPYGEWLATSDAAIVTEDSTNMLTDAAFFGLPVHLYRLEGGDARFDRLHDAFVAQGAARWFNGTIEHWTYPDLRNQTLAVARRIRVDLATKRG